MVENVELPEEVQKIIPTMDPGDALPIGVEEGEPMILLRLSEGAEALLDDPELACDFKPTILLMPYDGTNVGVGIVQFQLNRDETYIFTTHYDITEQKMYDELNALLSMENYSVLIATIKNHTVLTNKTRFIGEFDPQIVLADARMAAENKPGDGLAYTVFNGIIAQIGDYPTVWKTLEELAPARNKWLLQM